MIPPSRDHRLLLPMCEVAPNAQRRTSLEALPPSTGRSCIRTARSPSRAAAIALHTPVSPPPATT